MLENSLNIWVIIGAVLTWVIFMLGVAQLSRFYTRFTEASKSLENHLNALDAQMKKMQSSLAELIIEQRRQSRLQAEQVDLKRAEMTGGPGELSGKKYCCGHNLRRSEPC